MTYRLNPIVEKIESPVKLILPNETTREYESRAEAGIDKFDKNYQIKSIRAEGSTVVVEMDKADVPVTTWTGEEQTFF